MSTRPNRGGLRRLKKIENTPQPLNRPYRSDSSQQASSKLGAVHMDFVSDNLANERRIKCLTVADDFSHSSVEITVDYGISGHYVTRRRYEQTMAPSSPVARSWVGQEVTAFNIF